MREFKRLFCDCVICWRYLTGDNKSRLISDQNQLRYLALYHTWTSPIMSARTTRSQTKTAQPSGPSKAARAGKAKQDAGIAGEDLKDIARRLKEEMPNMTAKDLKAIARLARSKEDSAAKKRLQGECDSVLIQNASSCRDTQAFRRTMPSC